MFWNKAQIFHFTIKLFKFFFLILRNTKDSMNKDVLKKEIKT